MGSEGPCWEHYRGSLACWGHCGRLGGTVKAEGSQGGWGYCGTTLEVEKHYGNWETLWEVEGSTAGWKPRRREVFMSDFQPNKDQVLVNSFKTFHSLKVIGMGVTVGNGGFKEYLGTLQQA